MKQEIEIIKNKYRNIEYTITYVSDKEQRYECDRDILVSSFDNKDVEVPYRTHVDYANADVLEVEDFFKEPFNKDLLYAERRTRESIDDYYTKLYVNHLQCNREQFDKLFEKYASRGGELNKASYRVREGDKETTIMFNTTKSFNADLIKTLLTRLGIPTDRLMTYREWHGDAYRGWSSSKHYSHVLSLENTIFARVANLHDIRNARREAKRYNKNKGLNLKWQRRDVISMQDKLQQQLQDYLKEFGAEGKYKFNIKLERTK